MRGTELFAPRFALAMLRLAPCPTRWLMTVAPATRQLRNGNPGVSVVFARGFYAFSMPTLSGLTKTTEEQCMKRLIIAASLAALAVPALADDSAAPYEQSLLDRGIAAQALSHDRASGGSSGAVSGTFQTFWATGPWANDYSFIAPAQ